MMGEVVVVEEVESMMVGDEGWERTKNDRHETIKDK
jgi:hypothetical protein